jgi:hypothetical protein
LFQRLGVQPAAPLEDVAAGERQASARQRRVPIGVQDNLGGTLADFVELFLGHFRASSSSPPIPRGRMMRTTMMKRKMWTYKLNQYKLKYLKCLWLKNKKF